MNDCCDVFGDSADAARGFSVNGFIMLWNQHVPALADLVDTADPSVRQMIERLQREGRLELDTNGNLIGVHGLTRRPTRHRIERATGTNYTWCALDAVGIPAAVGIDAVAITQCPTCGAELRVEITGGVPNTTGPFVLWLPTGSCEHLMNEFCSNANLFCSDEHLSRWSRAAHSPAGRQLTLTEAAKIGRASWADVAESLGRAK